MGSVPPVVAVCLALGFGFAALPTGLCAVAEGARDNFESRLSEIPRRLRQLAEVAYPQGLADALARFYTLDDAQEAACRNHSALYRQALHNFEPWAVQMLDSSGKVPSGMMHGHFHSMGNFQECLEVADAGPYPVQHCVVQIGNIVRVPVEPIDWHKVDTVIGGIPILKPRLNIGVCMPASCRRDAMVQHYAALLDRFNLTVHMDKYSCTASNESTPFTWLDLFTVDLLLMLILLVLIATAIDLKYPSKGDPGVGREILNCFSCYQNGRILFKTETTKRPLATLNAFRFLSVAWVIICHHYLFTVIRPAINYVEISQLFTRFYAGPILNGIMAVDNFILLNGLLLSYLFLEAMNKGHKFNLIIFYMHRLIRILPGYSVQLLLTFTLFNRYYGNGPLWKYYIQRHTENCYESWWTNILFINNYVMVDKQCIPSTWYLSVDMQLHFIAPVFLFALYKWRWFVRVGIPLLIVVANAISFLNSYLNEFPAGSIIARDFKTVHTYPYEYITTHNKLGPWFVGLGLGYVLFYSREKRVKIPKNLVRLCWLASFVVGMTLLLSITYFHQDDIEYDRILSSSYTGFHSTIWSLCIAWVIFACETGHGGAARTLLTWRLFQPLGKMTFVLYMSHIGIQYGNASARKISGYIEIPSMVSTIFGEIVVCILIAPFFSCFFESPYIGLEKIFINKCIIAPKNKRDEEMKAKMRPVNGTTEESQLDDEISKRPTIV